ncbi:MAG: efflux RND transporter periplasmic adaptor subunit [Pseudomonadota bacterium]
MRPLPKTKAVKDKAAKRAKADAAENVIGLTKSPESTTRQSASNPASDMDQRVATKKPFGRTLAVGLIAALLLGGAATTYIAIGLNSSQAVQADRIVKGTVEVGQFGETIPVNANVIPEDTVFLDTVEGGRITTLHVEDGAFVTSGTALVTLKNSDLELQVIGREAQYTQQLSNLAQSQMAFDQSQLRYDQQLMDAKLQIDLTRASLERRLPIEETGVSQSEIDRLRAELTHQEATYDLIASAKARDTESSNRNLNQLRQSVARMEDSVDIMRDSLDQLTLRAPIDGRISAMTLQPGQYLSPGSRVGQVDVVGSFKLRAYVNEFYLNRLSVGQIATAEMSGQTYDLTISKIYPTISDRLFEVDLAFAGNRPENLRRGQSVRLRISMGDEAQALTIPTGAYEASTGGQWVFVVSPDGQSATRRDIETGRKNPDRIEVISGLSEGETILTSSYDAYADRERITLTQ